MERNRTEKNGTGENKMGQNRTEGDERVIQVACLMEIVMRPVIDKHYQDVTDK